MSLFKTVLKVGALSAFILLLQIGSTLYILSHLASAGVAAYAATVVVAQVCILLYGMGYSPAAIRSTTANEEFYSAIWMLNCCLGLVICSVLAVLNECMVALYVAFTYLSPPVELHWDREGRNRPRIFLVALFALPIISLALFVYLGLEVTTDFALSSLILGKFFAFCFCLVCFLKELSVKTNLRILKDHFSSSIWLLLSDLTGKNRNRLENQLALVVLSADAMASFFIARKQSSEVVNESIRYIRRIIYPAMTRRVNGEQGEGFLTSLLMAYGLFCLGGLVIYGAVIYVIVPNFFSDYDRLVEIIAVLFLVYPLRLNSAFLESAIRANSRDFHELSMNLASIAALLIGSVAAWFLDSITIFCWLLVLIALFDNLIKGIYFFRQRLIANFRKKI